MGLQPRRLGVVFGPVVEEVSAVIRLFEQVLFLDIHLLAIESLPNESSSTTQTLVRAQRLAPSGLAGSQRPASSTGHRSPRQTRPEGAPTHLDLGAGLATSHERLPL